MTKLAQSGGGAGLKPAHKSARLLPRWWLSIFILALLLRGGWGVFRLATAASPSVLEFPDEEEYWFIAGSLGAGDGFRDKLGFQAARMPVYPALLSAFTWSPDGVAYAKAFQWMVGAGAAVLTAGLAAAMFGRRVGVVAGVLAACDPFLVFFSSLLLTETAFVTALIGLWWIIEPLRASRTLHAARTPDGGLSFISSARWVVVGAVAALCVYLRESSLGLVGLALVYVALVQRFERRAVLGAAIAGILVLASLVPWAARNRRVIGEWCWLTTRSGVSLYDGVGPQATGASDLGGVQQMPAVKHLKEAEWNRYFLKESRKAIAADPARILRLARTKLARMWSPFPNVATYQSGVVRTISAAWSLPVFAFAVAGVVLLPMKDRRCGARNAMFLLLPAVYVSMLHSLFVGSVRYRLGAMPMLEILAAFALVATAESIANHRTRDRSPARPSESGAGDS